MSKWSLLLCKQLVSSFQGAMVSFWSTAVSLTPFVASTQVRTDFRLLWRGFLPKPWVNCRVPDSIETKLTSDAICLHSEYGRCDDGSGCVAAPRIATTTETATETPGPTPTPVVNDCDYAPTVPGKSLRARWIRAPSKNSSGLTDCTGLYDAPSRGSYSVSYPSRNGSVPARFAAEVHPAPADNTDCACVGPVHKNTYLNL